MISTPRVTIKFQSIVRKLQYISSMQKTISSSCYDALVIKQENRTYKSTPFQVVFSSNLIKQIQKNRMKQKAQPYKLTFYVNDKEVDIAVKIDQSGRIVFQKIYNRKASAMVSDSSDVSDEQHSHKSSNKTIDSKKSKALQDKLEQYKNQHAPTKFWQFAWLFSHKKQEGPSPLMPKIDEEESNQTNLTKIKEQAYEGQQHSKQPLFHLSLCGNLLKKKETKQQILKTFYDHRVEYNQFIKDPPGYLNDGNLVVKIDDSIYTWQLGIAILTCRFAYGRDLTKEEIEDIIKTKFTKSRLFSFISGGSNITKLDIAEYEDQNQVQKDKVMKKMKIHEHPIIKFRKTPDSDLLKKMKLKYGKNIGKFELDVGEGIKETITMKIFLWDHSQKIIISDIDGTITKSDILGQILNKWIHTGVTKLFTEIYKRHYKIIYLTARAIGQYQQTSKFLETVEQDGISLPQGPLLMSPDGYMRSFSRQVIYKTPDYLKTKILASLNEVFPNTKNPIYCGFGNRQTDSSAYLKINIAPDKIFCITDKSVISRESDKQFSSSYISLLSNINDFFPEYFKDKAMTDSSDEENVDQYQAVGGNEEGLKKSKSVDGQSSQTNLEGYQSDELPLVQNRNKTRKSQHQISQTDLKSLQSFMKQTQKKQIANTKLYQEQLAKNEQNTVKINIQDPVSAITEAITKIADGQVVEQPQPMTRQIGTETQYHMVRQKSIVQQQIEQIKQQLREQIQSTPEAVELQKIALQNQVKKELKEDNQVPKNQVILTEEELMKFEQKSAYSKQEVMENQDQIDEKDKQKQYSEKQSEKQREKQLKIQTEQQENKQQEDQLKKQPENSAQYSESIKKTKSN